ncbi:unnamed protein product [Periconia digitata]|uniref:Uncharacterized protein n=1 Tax=Periconia digitata TaxID=1303443 RepID=A0A9W4XU26_9PLEO|nr:unnamed protein product [Periconia digitata]
MSKPIIQKQTSRTVNREKDQAACFLFIPAQLGHYLIGFRHELLFSGILQRSLTPLFLKH